MTYCAAVRTIASMTATHAQLSAEMRVVATIRALKASRGLSVDQVAGPIGMPRSTWFDRMRKGDFTIGEVVTIAEFFGVRVQDLVDGSVTVTKFRRDFHALAGGQAQKSPRGRRAIQSSLMNPVPTCTTSRSQHTSN